jgi:acyl-CoA synthetase (AMP-forming)/AMP-acid ligase II
MNIATILDMAADGFGERVAIGPRDGGLRVRDLRERARGLATHLPPGITALATLAPTDELTPIALFGAAEAGVSYAPLNFRLPEEVQAELLDRVRPAAVLDPAWAVTDTSARPYPEEPEHPAVLLFTSGTSSTPKVAVLDHDNLLAYVFNTLDFASADEDEAVLVAVPPFHIAGVAAILSATFVGRRVVPVAHFDAAEWCTVARDEAVTHAFVVPTMLARVVEVIEHDRAAVPPTLRHLAYGGARMPLPVLERALALLPDVAFVNAYGLTETSSTVCVFGPDDHRIALASRDPAVRARLTCAGRPVPGIELRIVNVDNQPIGADLVGEIQLRGAQIGGRYMEGEARLADDGWLSTGDNGWLDGEGYLFVEGRGDGTIIRGGENIAVAEIEDALLAHPRVSAAAVVGLPDPEWGEAIAAMVAARPGELVTAEELRDFAHEHLGSLKTPAVVIVREALPQTPTGKILHRMVREELLGLQDH